MSEELGTVDITAEQIAEFEHYVRFVSCDPAKNRQRFYLLAWHTSLHGEFALVCTWGRVGTLGRSRVIIFPPDVPTATSLARLIKRRFRRGYRVTEWY